MDEFTYRHKPTIIDVVKVEDLVAAQINGTLNLAPGWVISAMRKGQVEISPYVHGIVCYPLPGVPRVAAARDYLVHAAEEGDAINVIPHEVLDQLYEDVSNDPF